MTAYASAPRGAGVLPQPTREMWLGRYPGSVWMLVVFLLLAGTNLFFAITFPPNNKPATIDTVVGCLWTFGSAAALLILARHTPGWFLHVQMVGAILVTAGLIYGAKTPLGGALFGWAYSMVAMYAAVWMSRRMAQIYLGTVALAYLIVLYLREALPYMLVTWLLTMTVCAAIAYLLMYLVSSLRNMAVTDSLTGLLNRAGLESVLRTNRVFGTPTSLVVIDLDDFKNLNDTQGHLAGDDALRRMGQALADVTGSGEYAFRTGGDEFMLILPNQTPGGAIEVVAQVRRVTRLALSAGVVEWPTTESFDSAVRRADESMYRNKADRDPD
jgi:diguanylate cyclase (GGDEF)-like protein